MINATKAAMCVLVSRKFKVITGRRFPNHCVSSIFLLKEEIIAILKYQDNAKFTTELILEVKVVTLSVHNFRGCISLFVYIALRP